MSRKDIKAMSREKTWTIDESEKMSTELINTAALLRIADASEMMAKNFLQLQNDVQFYQAGYVRRGKEIEGMANTIRSMKGHITRLKNKL